MWLKSQARVAGSLRASSAFSIAEFISGIEMRAWSCFARNKDFQCVSVPTLRHYNISQAPFSPTLMGPEMKQVIPRTTIVRGQPTPA